MTTGMITENSDKIFNYIKKQYGSNVLTKVQSQKNKQTVTKLLQFSEQNVESVEHTANKIIAMLRLNP